MKKVITTKAQADTLLFVSIALIMLGGLTHFLPYVNGLTSLFCLGGTWLLILVRKSEFWEVMVKNKLKTPLPFLERLFEGLFEKLIANHVRLWIFACFSVVLSVVGIIDMLLAFFR